MRARVCCSSRFDGSRLIRSRVFGAAPEICPLFTQYLPHFVRRGECPLRAICDHITPQQKLAHVAGRPPAKFASAADEPTAPIAQLVRCRRPKTCTRGQGGRPSQLADLSTALGALKNRRPSSRLLSGLARLALQTYSPAEAQRSRTADILLDKARCVAHAAVGAYRP
jgi:hypothetical protein